MKLIKTQDRFILVSDEEIKVNDYFLSDKLIHKAEEIIDCDNDGKLEIHSESYCNPYSLCRKIIAGIPSLPSIDFSLLSEADCKEIGYSKELEVILKPEHIELLETGNIEYSNLETIYNLNQTFIKRGDKWFVEAAQSLNDKMFSLKQMKQLHSKTFSEGVCFGASPLGYKYESFEDIIQSLQQTEWDVEVEMEYTTNVKGDRVSTPENLVEKPKITNNSIKVLKII